MEKVLSCPHPPGHLGTWGNRGRGPHPDQGCSSLASLCPLFPPRAERDWRGERAQRLPFRPPSETAWNPILTRAREEPHWRPSSALSHSGLAVALSAKPTVAGTMRTWAV